MWQELWTGRNFSSSLTGWRKFFGKDGSTVYPTLRLGCLLRTPDPLVPSPPLVSATQATAHQAMLCALALATQLHVSPFSFFSS